MGYLICYGKNGEVENIIGDEYGIEKAKKSLGLPYRKPNGHYVSDTEQNEIDKYGE